MEAIDEDIKAECVEIVPEIDVSSVTVNIGSFMLERNERETVIRFIELVRKCPEIWDVTGIPYRNKLLRRRSFRKIGEELGWSYDDVVKKYNNLRTYYTKEIIKQKKIDYFQSKWPYFEQLDTFLRKTVHVRVRQSGGLGRWAMLANRTNDRLGSYDGGLGSAGMRRKRLMMSTGDVRQRNSFHMRAATTQSVPATSSAPPPSPPPPQQQQQQQHQQQQQPSLSISSSSPIMSTVTNVPQANISHLPTITIHQQPRQSTSSSVSSQLQRQHVQSHSTQQRQQVPQRQIQQLQSQAQHHQPKVPPMAPKTAAERHQTQSTSSSLPPTSSSSSSSSSSANENSDVLFGKLIASQLAKIKEGRKKEQVKISLMQQIVQAMFDDGDN